MDILEKRELENMNLFYKYINFKTCPTSFAIASGAIGFRDENKMICSNYFVNDTNEMNYREVLTIDNNGEYRYRSKLDKFLPGIRAGLSASNLNENLVYDMLKVNDDIFVIEYGYFPKSRIEKTKNKISTDVKIKLPVSKYSYSVPEYKDFTIYKDDEDTYFVEYPVNSMTTIENKDFIPGEKGLFKIEPVRFWVDNKSELLISQDVIMGGIPYKLSEVDIPYAYDDYYDSDVYKALQIIEEDMIKLDKLINHTKGKTK